VGASGGSGECEPDPPQGTGDQCATPIDLGVVSDVAGDGVVVTGNGALAMRSIWWVFEAEDDLDTAGDEYHVDVRFLDNPDGGYEMGVYRGDCTPTDLVASSETEAFDWYTDFPKTDQGCTEQPPCGEGDCVATDGDPDHNVCTDDTETFYVRVTRTGGVVSCEPFEIEISNGKYAASNP
jgi:hypothetical protein